MNSVRLHVTRRAVRPCLGRAGRMLAAACLVFLGSLASVGRAQEVSLTVLQTTDVHGSKNFERIVALIEQERRADPDVLVVDCGDLTHGSFEAFLDGGAGMVALLNAARYDVWVPGNHEFRIGQENLRHDLDLFTAGDVLAANLRFDEGSLAPRRAILPWKMFQRKGLKVAAIGLTYPTTQYWFSASAYQNITLVPAGEVLDRAMAALGKQSPDVVILATHMDATSPVESSAGKHTTLGELLKHYPQISLVLAGHTHRAVPAKELREGVWEVQPPIHAQALGKIRIAYNKQTQHVEGVTSEFLPTKAVEPASDLPAAWTALQEEAAVAAKKPIVRLPEGLRLGPMKKGETASPLASLFARAMAQAAGTDAALGHTYGTWRSKGRDLTALDFYEMTPNEYSISVLTLTPEQLKTILSEQEHVAGRSYGLDLEHLPDRPITVAFDAYDTDGSDGTYPLLRKMAASGQVHRRDTSLNVRDSLKALLMKLYPVE